MTINYFSPYLVIDSALSGVVNGSLIVFGSMLVGSLFFGRLWCGWACPAGGLQDGARGASGGCRGTCADGCTSKVTRYSFSAGK